MLTVTNEACCIDRGCYKLPRMGMARTALTGDGCCCCDEDDGTTPDGEATAAAATTTQLEKEMGFGA